MRFPSRPLQRRQVSRAGPFNGVAPSLTAMETTENDRPQSTPPAQTWQELEAQRRAVAQEARALPPEPDTLWVRLVFWGVVALWLASLAWAWFALPERVPTHWSGDNQADTWSSRAGAIVPAALIPAVALLPMPLLSRLATIWPDGLNVPHKEWWLQTAPRVRRFERLLREDLMLITASVLAIFPPLMFLMHQAAQRDGVIPGWGMPLVLAIIIVPMVIVLARMAVGRRYKGAADL
ncbi:Predicted integral membrane protein [Kytococcus sedentarius]|nr:Predicted integral membrane protein [Kytococcus sedentarius]